MKEIKGFDGEYAFLSNFYDEYPLYSLPLMVWSDDNKVVTSHSYQFPTSEHAFHAFKVFKDWKHPHESELPAFEAFLKYETPGKAKRAGRKVPLNPEYWDSVKDEVMYYICSWKFRGHTFLWDKLLATGDAYLEETNTWGDKYWGVCNGEGLNHLGLILMKIRKELQNGEGTDLGFKGF